MRIFFPLNLCCESAGPPPADFAFYAQNKWGVINQNGEQVIIPSYQEMIVIPNKEKDVFICTYNINEQTGTYQTKAINNRSNKIQCEATFDDVASFFF